MKKSRQSFLGLSSSDLLLRAKIAVVGLGGGGSHVVQQLAHVGIGRFVLIDPDHIEASNLNRLVGGTLADVEYTLSKVDIAARTIGSLNPNSSVTKVVDNWQSKADVLRDCDVIVSCVDTFTGRDELEKSARRYHIPLVDIGMDVEKTRRGHSVYGQVALSLPGAACLHCMNVLRSELIRREAQAYGDAGGRPQVIWPNAILASTAVSLVINLITGWNKDPVSPLLEYDGNSNEIRAATSTPYLQGLACRHFSSVADLGDPWFSTPKA